jgi:hypothetical protein
MHIEGPWLSTTGKRKGKVKFRNADEARKARELDESWKDMQKRWGIEAEQKRKDRALKAEPLSYSLSAPHGRDTGPKLPSRDTGHTGAVRTKDIPKYTGTLIKGIATMHKSNAVPVLNQEQAEEISKMRR